MSVEIDLSQISDKQYRFLSAKERHVAYGGARGGGKSWAVRTKATILALTYPGIKMLILRHSYRELLNNHVGFLRAQLNGIARYNSTDKIFRFTNGSTIALGYCANDGDLDQYQGAEYDVLFIDEAGQLQKEWIEKLNACVRGTNGFPKRTYYTLNPGGPAHAYFKRLFIDREFRGNERPEDYTFIQALVTDNKALMEAQPEYVEELKNLPPHLRKMWLEGSWDIFAGQFFEDFVPNPDVRKAEELGTTVEQLRQQHRWCHVIEPFHVPEGWKIYRSYDFGYHKPFSCAWWAVDYDGVFYRILELYGCTETPNEGLHWNPDRQFEEIHRIETTHQWLKGRQIRGVADPAIWDNSHGESIAETAVRHGVYFQKGENARIPGWMQVHYRLAFDEEGFAMMYIFSNCTAFIRTIPTLMYDNVRPEDLNTDMEDHVADETRYFCMTRPIKPRRPQVKEKLFSDPLDQMTVKRHNFFGG